MSNIATEVPTQTERIDLHAPETLVLGESINPPKAREGIPERFERILTIVETLLDVLATTLAILFAYWVDGHRSRIAYPGLAQVVLISLGFGVLCALLLDREGAYRSANSLLRVRETERVLRICAQGYIVALALIRFDGWHLSIPALNLYVALTCAALLLEKHLLYLIVRLMHVRGVGVIKVVILGAGYTGRRVYNALSRSPKLGLKPIAILDENPLLDGARVYESSYRRDAWLPVSSVSFSDLDLNGYSDCMMIVAIPSLSRDKFLHLLNSAGCARVRFAFVPTHHVPSDVWTEHSDLDGLLLESFTQLPRHVLYEISKRTFDVAFSLLALLATAPFSCLIAFLIRRESEGPVLFQQTRVGKGGRSFKCYKFRTMYEGSPAYSVSPIDSTDPRITRVGRFLRRTSLDELPQLLNVLKGDMSLVGPRPEMPFLVNMHSSLHRPRLQVKPGITGLWQISADRQFLIHENIEYDLYYIRNRNFFVDLAILVHTIFFAMRGI